MHCNIIYLRLDIHACILHILCGKFYPLIMLSVVFMHGHASQLSRVTLTFLPAISRSHTQATNSHTLAQILWNAVCNKNRLLFCTYFGAYITLFRTEIILLPILPYFVLK